MSVFLIYRNPNAGFSIYRCFEEFKMHLDIKELFLPEYRISVLKLIRNIKYIKKNVSKDDIIHITGDIHYVLLGLIGKKTILTIHDTVLLDNCKKKNLKWLLYYLFWFYFPCKIAKKVVCISNETNNRLQKYVKCNSIVIPDPVSSSFNRKDKIFNSNCPTILHIGTGWNKNLDNVIKALSGLNVNLVIIGKISSSAETLLISSNIKYAIKQNLSSDEIIAEYENCDIISFPSIYEGFGLPIIEGQTVGRIVITSNIEPHVSVPGKNGAIFVDPNNVDSIRDGFLRAINDNVLRENIINNGFNNSKHYSFKNIVNEYNKIYEYL